MCDEHYMASKQQKGAAGSSIAISQNGSSSTISQNGSSSTISQNGSVQHVMDVDGSSTEDEKDARHAAAASAAAAAVSSAAVGDSGAANCQRIIPGMNVLIGKGLGGGDDDVFVAAIAVDDDNYNKSNNNDDNNDNKNNHNDDVCSHANLMFIRRRPSNPRWPRVGHLPHKITHCLSSKTLFSFLPYQYCF
jgi:hypothetical protein